MSADDSAAVPAAALPVAAAVSLFSYSAQTRDGLRISGTLEAPGNAAAVQVLEIMGLRVMDVASITERKSRPLRDDAWVVFNRQLAQMAKAGLPVEKGLRLLAAQIQGGTIARAAGEIAQDLRSGSDLVTAFEKHRGQFPPLYGRMIDAGIRGGNLPGVLLVLGRRLETQQRLRATLWRSVSYPLMTLGALLVVISFIGLVLAPRFEAMFASARLEIPLVTQMVMAVGRIAPYAAIAIILAIAAVAVARWILRKTEAERAVIDRVLIGIPFIGPVLRFNLIARWVDAVSIGIAAGLELPAAIALAADATASPLLRKESAELKSLLESGRPLSTAQGKLLPATVAASLDLSASQRDVPDTLQTLSDLYDRQAQLRLERIPAVLTPLLVMLIAILVGFVIFGLLFPLFVILEDLLRIFR